tara:strand:- start:4496 stop:4798 length:303 start_codon:yes stop_codon:yes gene_type:complete
MERTKDQNKLLANVLKTRDLMKTHLATFDEDDDLREVLRDCMTQCNEIIMTGKLLYGIDNVMANNIIEPKQMYIYIAADFIANHAQVNRKVQELLYEERA